MTTDYIHPGHTARLDSPDGPEVTVLAYTRLGYVQVRSLGLSITYETPAARLHPC